jgi:hypothetical protein
VLGEAEDHEEALDGHLNDCLPDKGRPEEHAEGDQEVPAQETRQVE